MKVTLTITRTINRGEFLQTFASDGKREVSYCHKSLPFTDAGVLNALMAQYLAPPYVAPKVDPNAPKPVLKKLVVQPQVPSAARVAKVKTLENVYKALKATKPLSITFEVA